MRRWQVAALVACAAAVPALADAQAVEIIPFVAYQSGGEFEDQLVDNQNVEIKNSAAFGLACDVELSDNWTVELLYSHQGSDLDLAGTGEIGIDVHYLQAGGLFFLRPGERTNPYFVLALGATRLSPEGGESADRFSGSFGLGVKFELSERVGLRLDGRVFSTRVQDEDTPLCTVETCLVYGKTVLYQYSLAAGLIIRL